MSNYPDDEGRDYVKELSREEVLRAKIWITQDGRHLHVTEIADDHLKNIVRFCERNLITAEHDRDYIITMQDYKEDPRWLIDAERDVSHWASWIKIFKAEQLRRTEASQCEHGTSGCIGKGEKHWCDERTQKK